MSLLEDVFLQDEANEAEELERVIEGDEFEERRRSDSDDASEKEDEAEEDKTRVDPAKAKATRVVKNPRFLLNPARLTGPRGIQVIPDHFKDFKFKGKGHEKEDLDLVLKRLEHWAYRLYPKFQFEDCLKKIEMLGKKRPVAVHLHKIRSDQFLSEDTVVQKDSSDEDTPMPVQEEDEFDKLLQQQIDMARNTPAPNSAKKPGYNGSVSPKDKRTTSLMMPKATSSPSISDEQRERMLRSRRLAEERRQARLKNAPNTSNTIPETSSESVNPGIEPIAQNIEVNVELTNNNINDTEEIATVTKHNRSNVIDSSDDEEVQTHVSIAVDVHTDNSVTIGNKESGKSEKSPLELNGDDSDIKSVKDNGTEEILDENTLKSKRITATNSELNLATENETAEESVTSTVHENSENPRDVKDTRDTNTFKVAENSAENSGQNEELRYDDSDMNIDTNEHNDTNKNIDNADLPHDETLDKNLKDSTSKDDEIKSQEAVQNQNNVENKDVPENILDDVMDVDFSEDF